MDRDGVYREDWVDQATMQDDIISAREGLVGSEILYGMAPLFAALSSQRRTMHTLYVQVSFSFSDGVFKT